jgi:aminoglycoside 6'-N-acetyltransferase I
VLVLYLGTDDENGQTSLGGTEIFPGVLDRLRELRNLGGHPFEAYQRLGFEVIGVIPHANGFGRPDIYMAKSLRPLDGC